MSVVSNPLMGNQAGSDPLQSRRISFTEKPEKFSTHQLDQLPPKTKLSVDDVPATLEGLQQLMDAGCWRAVLRLSEKQLTNTFYRHDLLQLRLCRVVAHMKLRMHKAAQDEVNELGDFDSTPNLFEDYPSIYKNMRGSMIPFTLRVLKAILPFHLKTSTSLDGLYELLSMAKRQMSNMTQHKEEIDKNSEKNAILKIEDSITPLEFLSPPFHFNNTPVDISHLMFGDLKNTFKTWEDREKSLSLLICTRLVMDREYTMAILQLSEISKKYPEDESIMSSLGRVYLQLGSVKAATTIFKQVETLLESRGDVNNSVVAHMNRGYISIASDQFSTAINHFQQVLKMDENNAIAANNRAICHLYTCNLSQAISSLEDFILKKPDQNMNEVLVSNLCTLYDLKSDNSADRKKNVLGLVAKYAGDDFDFGVIKLNSS